MPDRTVPGSAPQPIAQVRVGRGARLGRTTLRSAIAKSPVGGPVEVGPLGLAGDEQVAPVHGGPDRAVLQYCSDHYPDWRDTLPQAAHLLHPGAFGENLVVAGMDEGGVCVGDVVRAGTALLQVTQPRSPCYKLDHHLGIRGMARKVQASGRSGWLYRVLQPGLLGAGDTLTVVDRPHPQWTIRRVQHALYVDRQNLALAAELAALPELAGAQRRKFERRVRTGTPEDDTNRLDGPPG